MNMNNTTKMTTIDTAIVSYLNDYHDVNRLFYKGSSIYFLKTQYRRKKETY